MRSSAPTPRGGSFVGRGSCCTCIWEERAVSLHPCSLWRVHRWGVGGESHKTASDILSCPVSWRQRLKEVGATSHLWKEGICTYRAAHGLGRTSGTSQESSGTSAGSDRYPDTQYHQDARATLHTHTSEVSYLLGVLFLLQEATGNKHPSHFHKEGI